MSRHLVADQSQEGCGELQTVLFYGMLVATVLSIVLTVSYIGKSKNAYKFYSIIGAATSSGFVVVVLTASIAYNAMANEPMSTRMIIIAWELLTWSVFVLAVTVLIRKLPVLHQAITTADWGLPKTA